jgi:choline dehydrogenase-like flavoprotein
MKEFATGTQVDFVVVGAGAAGGVVAKELATAGFQVVVLEQGPYLREADFRHDELRFRDIYDKPYIGQEILANNHELQPNSFRRTDMDVAQPCRWWATDAALAAERSTLPRITGASTKSISSSAAAGARSKARDSRIGRSPMPTWNRTTRKRSMSWGFPA